MVEDICHIVNKMTGARSTMSVVVEGIAEDLFRWTVCDSLRAESHSSFVWQTRGVGRGRWKWLHEVEPCQVQHFNFSNLSYGSVL